MYVRNGMFLVIVCAGLITVLHSIGSDSTSDSWTKADEKSLRQLISTSDVRIGMFLNSNGLPYQTLIVPEEFVELYRKSPSHCLKVLQDIVEHGSKQDAIAAFQFGYAGDEAQIALPPLHYLNPHLIDSHVGNGGDTYRAWCLQILQRRMKELATPPNPSSPGNRDAGPREL